MKIGQSKLVDDGFLRIPFCRVQDLVNAREWIPMQRPVRLTLEPYSCHILPQTMLFSKINTVNDVYWNLYCKWKITIVSVIIYL